MLWNLWLKTFSILALANVQFDYFGTVGGRAQIRGKCTPFEKDHLKCQFTEVRPGPLQGTDEWQTINLALPDYRTAKIEEAKKKKAPITYDFNKSIPEEELKKFWLDWYPTQIEKTPETLQNLKQTECDADPRDYYKSRAVYNETYDNFLNQAKAIQAKLCQAKNAKDFVLAMNERWALVKVTCELSYAHYDEILRKKRDSVWETEGPIKGSEVLKRCFGKGTTRLDCSDKNGCKLSKIYLERVLEKSETTMKFSNKYRPWFIKPLKNECADFTPILEEYFEASLNHVKPENCKYFLDRERASECCAYSK